MSVFEKMIGVAEEMKAKAEQELDKTKMHKSNDIPLALENSNIYAIVFANTFKNIALKLQSGKDSALCRVRDKTDLNLLSSLLWIARVMSNEHQGICEGTYESFRDETKFDTNFASYPYPRVIISTVLRLCAALENANGFKKMVEYVKSQIGDSENVHADLVDPALQKNIKRIAENLITDKDRHNDAVNILDNFKDFDKLQNLAIYDIKTLKTALVELIELRGKKPSKLVRLKLKC